MDPESLNQIVKAITSLHDGRTWKPETIAAVIAALAATGAATVTFILGKRQIASAQTVAQQQIDAAEKNAQRQIKAAQDAADLQIASAQAVAKQQVESAQTVARQQLVMPMREAWIGKLREKIAWYIGECGRLYAGEKFDNDSIGAMLAGRHEILLMLDVREKAQLDLDSMLTGLFEAARVKPREPKRFRDVLDRANQLARDILKSEWTRAKAGE